MEDLQPTVNIVQSIWITYGISFAIFAVILIAFFIYLKSYVSKAGERAAEDASEKNLKKFQAHLDQELTKFQHKHQKQIDAVHELYQAYQRLCVMIQSIYKPEKFTRPFTIKEEIAHLIRFRHEFRNLYLLNRLLFNPELNFKIDSFIDLVDSWIEKYQGGLILNNEEDVPEKDDSQSMFLAGVWPMGAFDEIETSMAEIQTDLEAEFREIYGTDN